MTRIAALLFLLAANQYVFAQHIQYRDKKKPAAQQTQNIPAKDSTLPEIITPHNECPGMDASLPVVMNYTPADIINKFKVMFQGHLYCITSIKVTETDTQYKLRICYKGEFVERYVNVDGVMVR